MCRHAHTRDEQPRGKTEKRKRNYLSLKMKYEVILASERESGIASRKLAKLFNCGKSQIQGILKNKQYFKDLYEQNASDKMKHCRKCSRNLIILRSMNPVQMVSASYIKEYFPGWQDSHGEDFRDCSKPRHG